MTNQTPSLGDLLREKIQRDADSAARLAQQKLDDEAALKSKEERIVKAFFDSAKADFVAAITTGRETTSIQIGHGHNDEVAKIIGGYRNEIVSPSHRLHSIWTEFQSWADSNGLKALWNAGWDTGAMNSWQLLNVAPR